MKKLIAIALLLLLCLIPIIPISAEYQYTSLEPYTVEKTIQVPYQSAEEFTRWEESESYRKWKSNFKTSIEDSVPSYYGVGQIPSGRWVSDYQYVTRYRNERTSETRYRQVEKHITVKRNVSLWEWMWK